MILMGKQIVSAKQASGIPWADLKKRLFVIEPIGYETGIKTAFSGPEGTDAVRADVFVKVGPGADEWESFEDALIFPSALIGQTRRQIGKVVVGRLTQGEAKRGQSAPWLLAEANEQDITTAAEFLAQRDMVSVSQGSNGSSAGDVEDFGSDDFGEEDEGPSF